MKGASDFSIRALKSTSGCMIFLANPTVELSLEKAGLLPLLKSLSLIDRGAPILAKRDSRLIVYRLLSQKPGIDVNFGDTIYIMERDYYLAFSSFPGVGPKRFNQLLKEFKSAKKAWNSNRVDKVLGEKLAGELVEFKKKYSVELYARELRKRKVKFLTLNDKDYPKLLFQIPNPPFILYYRGETSIFSYPTIGIVGTRKITSYGREVTDIFASELSLNGFTIVSGLALGVDAQAARSTLDVKGKTIAVLGCGVDCVTPTENEPLYNSIVKANGAVVSEYPLGHPPTIGSFPSRNRIIAGLSQGILVTEGAEDSGALITADYALKFKRKVFAVPGPITSTLSKGPFKLISKGAKLVTSPQDIINELGSKNQELGTKPTSPRLRGSRDEMKILQILQNEPLHFDDIVKRSKLNPAKLGSLLSLMEVKGLVKSQGGGFFSVST